MGIAKVGLKLEKEIIAWARTGGKSMLATKPVKVNITGLKLAPLTSDTVCITNPLNQINNTLRNIYGIDSKITDFPLAEKMLRTVEKFSSLNKKKNLFNGLELNCEVLPTKEIALRNYNIDNGRFLIRFNKNFDFAHLEKITKEAYNAGKIPSDDPYCLLYRELGHFLNFKNNPSAYHIVKDRHFVDESGLVVRRLSDSVNIADFNANYIAGRMCGKTYPKELYAYFDENLGNINLRYPKPIPVNINQGSIHKFNKIADVQKYLSENYGIEAEFINIQQANYFAGAVDDLCKMTGNKDCFRGLKATKELGSVVTTQMSTHWNYKTGKASITFNPAFDWKQEIKKTNGDFQVGFYSTPNAKGRYIHELSHWLDFKGNPVRYGQTCINFNEGTSFSEVGLIKASKVSQYAATNPAEFCAEYIAAKFDGIKFPKCVDDMFKEFWNGPNLNFPQ